MPIYEYECSSCKKVVEVIQRITEKPLATCPECNGKVTKLVSMSAFHLKGNGWYADGYSDANSSKSNGNGKNGGTSSVKEKSPSGKNKPSEAGKVKKTEGKSSGKAAEA